MFVGSLKQILNDSRTFAKQTCRSCRSSVSMFVNIKQNVLLCVLERSFISGIIHNNRNYKIIVQVPFVPLKRSFTISNVANANVVLVLKNIVSWKINGHGVTRSARATRKAAIVRILVFLVRFLVAENRG